MESQAVAFPTGEISGIFMQTQVDSQLRNSDIPFHMDDFVTMSIEK